MVTSLGWDKGIFGICTFHIIPFLFIIKILFFVVFALIFNLTGYVARAIEPSIPSNNKVFLFMFCKLWSYECSMFFEWFDLSWVDEKSLYNFIYKLEHIIYYINCFRRRRRVKLFLLGPRVGVDNAIFWKKLESKLKK